MSARAFSSAFLSDDIIIFAHQLSLQAGGRLASSSQAEISQLFITGEGLVSFALRKRAQIGRTWIGAHP